MRPCHATANFRRTGQCQYENSGKAHEDLMVDPQSNWHSLFKFGFWAVEHLPNASQGIFRRLAGAIEMHSSGSQYYGE